MSNKKNDVSVNYLWLSPRDSYSQKQSEHATHLPLHYFERLSENAAKYPDAEFNLWLDFSQLRPKDHFFLSSHLYFMDTENVNIRNLRDVELYRNSPGFDLDSNIAIYAKADYARILVLDHELRQGTETAVYSDLDCQDIRIDDPDVIDALQHRGIVFGRSGNHAICNAYISLHGEKGRVCMDDYLLPQTEIAFQKNKTNHFGAFSKATGNYKKAFFPDESRKQWGLVETPFMRTTMPYSADKYQNVCPTYGARQPGNLDIV